MCWRRSFSHAALSTAYTGGVTADLAGIRIITAPWPMPVGTLAVTFLAAAFFSCLASCSVAPGGGVTFERAFCLALSISDFWCLASLHKLIQSNIFGSSS